MTLKDALELPIFQLARLLTRPGLAGDREVNSVSVIEVPVGKFVRAGEFVISSGMNVGHDPRLLGRFIQDVANAGASALALAVGPYTPKIPRRAVKTAESLGLAFIELPWELRFSEISEAILRRLIQDQAAIRTRDDFVWALANQSLNEGAALVQANHLGFDLRLRSAAVVGHLSNAAERPSQRVQEQTRVVENLCAKVATRHHVQWLGTVVGDRVLGYLQSPRSKQGMKTVLTPVQSLASSKCTVSWGVGRVCLEFSDFQKSYEDARVASDIGSRARPGSLTDITDVLADRVLLKLVRDGDVLMLLDRYVKPLRAFRRMPLQTTLETFFEHDCNASEAARILSISRQSLLYRLSKVETLLRTDLHNAEQRFAMTLALRLQRFQDTVPSG